MRIQLKLMGLLKDKLPEGGLLKLPDASSIEFALQTLDIPVESVQVFTVNGQLERDQQRTLSDGDELSIVPPVGGG